MAPLSLATLFVLAGLGALLVVTFVFLRNKAPAARHGGSLVEAFRVVTSTPTFLVPAAMTATAVGALMLTADGGGLNPWMRNTGGSFAFNAALLAIVAVGVAGLVGLLEAKREGSTVGPDAFMRGISRHAIALITAKLSIAVVVYLMHERNAFGIHHPNGFGEWIVFAIPSALIAPTIGTVSQYPGRPLAAMALGLGVWMRSPLTMARIAVLQLLVTTGVVCALDNFLPWSMSSEQRLAEISAAHNSSIGFGLFPSIWYGLVPAGFLFTLLVAAGSTVFVAAYWTTVNGALLPQNATSTTTGPAGTRDQEKFATSSRGE